MALPEHRADREYQKFVLDPDGNVAVRYQSSQVPQVLSNNSSNTLLAADASYVGEWTDVSDFTTVVTAVLSDIAGTLHMEFSYDGVTTHSTLTYNVAASINEVHTLVITRQYYRTRFVNGSTGQATFNLSTIVGDHGHLSAPANLNLGQDADATVSRQITEETDIVQGKRTGLSIVNKFGVNPDIDTTTLPEDVWDGGGTYTGFPTGSAETVEVFSSTVNDDDTTGSGAHSIRIYGLDANGDQQNEEILLDGTNAAASANTYTRVFRGIIETSGSSNTAFNDGTITCRHTATTANIFFVMAAGTNQTRVSAYTVPLGKTAYLRHFSAFVNQNNAGTATGALWIRETGKSPRLVRPFTLSAGSSIEDNIFGGLPLPALTDIIVRISSVSNNNTEVSCHYDMLVIND